ncbi:MAG TPA: Wzz/FepE/Etk N-terminal domain-containing protein, partial [Candidatus Acidoferrales bacterium]|nr:Wzz/FepE/Etk N-terminal domain-containing protein [Candidatus Acidoferrales bacterium]
MNHDLDNSMRAEEMIGAVLRRWKAVMSVIVTGIMVSGLLAWFEKSTFQANAKLMVTSERARMTVSPDPHSGSTVERVTDQDLNSEVALLQSPGLLREVLEPYRARIEQEGEASLLARLHTGLVTPLRNLFGSTAPRSNVFDEWMASIAHRLSIDAIKGSNLIEIGFEGGDPKWVATVVNDLTQHHVDRHAHLTQQSAALEFLEQQRQLLAEKVSQAEAALTEFSRREGGDVSAAQRAALRTRVAELESALASAEIDQAEANAGAQPVHLGGTAAAAAGNGAGDLGATLSQDPLQGIRNRINELRLQRADLASRLAPTSLKLQMFDQQITEAEELLKKETKRASQERVTVAKARTNALSTHLEAERAKLRHLDEISPESDRLEQDLTSAREAFLTYSKKVEEARFSNALDQSHIVNVSIVERAEVPSIPRPSRKSLTLLLGTIMSLAAGLGLALL